MKTTQKLSIVLMLAFIISGNGITKAQGNENTLSIPTVGLGIHINQLNKIVVPINIINHIRLEPAIGFDLFKNKNNDSKVNILIIGFGVYGMWQKGQLNLYAGLKSGLIVETWNYGVGAVDGKCNTYVAGPAIGGEYFLGEHFSIGGLLGISTTLSKEPDLDPADKGTSDYSTDADLILRFYF